MKHDKQFIGVFALNKLPQHVLPGPCKLIVNLQYANLPGSHWTAIYRNDSGLGYYYDSFGRIPPLEIQCWLVNNCGHWTWNTLTIQYDLSSCGYLCIDFLKHV